MWLVVKNGHCQLSGSCMWASGPNKLNNATFISNHMPIQSTSNISNVSIQIQVYISHYVISRLISGSHCLNAKIREKKKRTEWHNLVNDQLWQPLCNSKLTRDFQPLLWQIKRTPTWHRKTNHHIWAMVERHVFCALCSSIIHLIGLSSTQKTDQSGSCTSFGFNFGAFLNDLFWVFWCTTKCQLLEHTDAHHAFWSIFSANFFQAAQMCTETKINDWYTDAIKLATKFSSHDKCIVAPVQANKVR